VLAFELSDLCMGRLCKLAELDLLTLKNSLRSVSPPVGDPVTEYLGSLVSAKWICHRTVKPQTFGKLNLAEFN
jgi:hypothetical protein